MREACVFEHLGQADARIAFNQAHIVKPTNMKVLKRGAYTGLIHFDSDTIQVWMCFGVA